MSEKIMILKMLDEGKITADEAERLIKATEKNPDENISTPFKEEFLKIQDKAKDLFNVFVNEFGEVMKDFPGTIFEKQEKFVFHKDVNSVHDKKGDSIYVEGINDNFEFLKTDEDKIKIEGKIYVDDNFIEGKDIEPDFNVEKKENGLLLSLTRDMDYKAKFSGKIYVPENIKIECKNSSGAILCSEIKGECNLTNENGAITAKNNEGNLIIHNKNGKIKINDLKGNLDIDTTNGSILVSDIKGNSNVHALNGSIKLIKPDGNIDLSTKNGSIKLLLKDALKDFENKLITKNGSIRVLMSGDIKTNILAKTKLGRVKISEELEAEFENNEYKINGGGPVLKLETQMGSISANLIK